MSFGRSVQEAKERRAAEKERNLSALCLPSKSLHKGTYSGATVRKSANQEACLVRLPGCDQDPAKTIWSHYRGSAGGKGMSVKSLDLAGAYACTYCDAVYDGQYQRPEGLGKEDVDRLWLEGHIRSLVRLEEKGLL